MALSNAERQKRHRERLKMQARDGGLVEAFMRIKSETLTEYIECMGDDEESIEIMREMLSEADDPNVIEQLLGDFVVDVVARQLDDRRKTRRKRKRNATSVLVT
jgi:macrodomain Ter protein organizer (MatP/YcbG family)